MCHRIYISYSYWSIYYVDIDKFEYSSNMQENLLKQWKYITDQGDNLLKTFLCTVYYLFIELVISCLCLGDYRRHINLRCALANEHAWGRTESTVMLWTHRKVEGSPNWQFLCHWASDFFLRVLCPVLFLCMDTTFKLASHCNKSVFVPLVFSFQK